MIRSGILVPMRKPKQIRKYAVCCVAGLGFVLGHASSLRAEPAGERATGVRVIAPLSTSVAVERVRAVIATLDDANRTGNYSVLRDIAAPEFKAANTLQDLAVAFAPLRDSRADLAFASKVAPEFKSSSLIDQDGALQLQGRFKGDPRDIQFDMSFVEADGSWLLTKLNVTAPITARSPYLKSVPAPGAQAPVPATAPVASSGASVVRSAGVRIETRPLRNILAGPTLEEAAAPLETRPDAPAGQSEIVMRNTWGVGLGPSVNAAAQKK